MTCTKEQIRKFMRYRNTHSLEAAAAKAGMSENSGRKYLKQGGKQLPKLERDYRTRKDPFADVWSQLEEMLSNDDGLEAKTLLEWLLEAYPNKYRAAHLRTLQRRVSEWRALRGPSKDIFFQQILLPGAQSQSDYTWCNELGITIAGQPFQHLLFHFMLPYSRWETASIAFSESFESLTEGYAAAVKELGAVAPDHRTDNLAAAVPIGERKKFQERWKNFLVGLLLFQAIFNPRAALCAVKTSRCFGNHWVKNVISTACLNVRNASPKVANGFEHQY